ncbi:MAG: CYTH domain-containing protein [Microbacterium sp.]
MTSAEPARSVEIELKLDADDTTPLPDLAALPGVVSVTAGEVHLLDARYLDTAELNLARAGFALRRRTGGPDAGWHVKGPLVDGARVELRWPLGEPGPVPADIVRMLAELTGASPDALAGLAPVARIRNERTAYLLLDAAGATIAEFADDRVAATDERAGVQRAWREWELELGDRPPRDPAAFFAAATAAMRSVGAAPATSVSKLARALGA